MNHPRRSIRVSCAVFASLSLAAGAWSTASRAQASPGAVPRAPAAHAALNPQPLPPASIDRSIARPVVGQKTGIIIVGGTPVATPGKFDKPSGSAVAKPKRMQGAP